MIAIQDCRMPCRLSGFVALALLLYGCGTDSGDEDLTPPPAPEMLVKNCTEDLSDWPEQGTDAAAGNLGIRLEWRLQDRPSDLAGFEIYRAMHPDSGFVLIPEDTESFLEGNPESFFYVDSDPLVQPTSHWGDRFWYLIRALDEAGNQSAPSDTASYRLWALPRLNTQGVDVSADTLRVRWQFDYSEYQVFGFRGFNLLIGSMDGQTLFHREDVLLNLQPAMELELFPATWGLAPGDYRLRVDTRIDHVANLDSLRVPVTSNPSNCALSGSESNWISFTF